MSRWDRLNEAHEKLKLVWKRGDPLQPPLAMAVYLRGLDREHEVLKKKDRREMEKVEVLLYKAWSKVGVNDHKAQVHMDEAQQRMHRVIRRLQKQYLKRLEKRSAHV